MDSQTTQAALQRRRSTPACQPDFKVNQELKKRQRRRKEGKTGEKGGKVTRTDQTGQLYLTSCSSRFSSSFQLRWESEWAQITPTGLKIVNNIIRSAIMQPWPAGGGAMPSGEILTSNPGDLIFRWPEVWRHLVVNDTCLASGRW